MQEGIAKLHHSPFVRLDFEERSLVYSNPTEIIETRDPSAVRACLELLRRREAAGFLSYEAGHAFEPKLQSLGRAGGPDEPPLLWFGIFEDVEVPPPLPPSDAAWVSEPKPTICFEDYAAGVQQIRSDIVNGDVYQVNFTFPCTAHVAGNPIALYAQLRGRACAPWSALVFTGTHWLISCSPELFFTSIEGRITCRPMKGTAPASADPETLRNDPKNRAENLMIVDLVRNDLSRVGKAGTVNVPELFAVEHYPTLLQMTSTVTAELETGLNCIDVLQAMFPCGSITGTPKIAAMERIGSLEQAEQNPRGPYTGSIGRIRENGDGEFNVAIRTLVLGAKEKIARYNVGSAIVIDSDPVSEWQECLQKAAFVGSRHEFQLFETFALGPKRNPLLSLHLNRLERSASELDFRFDRLALEAELARIGEQLRSPIRCRVSLERSGLFRIRQSLLPPPPDYSVQVTIAVRTNPPDDFRLAYKTSDRHFYDEARDAAGSFEVLFMDQDGFLTEGSFTNLFVRCDDHFVTPPLQRGLLPGILRQDLIERGRAIEEDLRPSDLASGFWIGNSLRGLMPAVLQR